MYDGQSTIHTGEEWAIGNGELNRFLLHMLMLVRLQLIATLNLWMMLRLCVENSEFTIQPWQEL